jgi:hypothetical protein
VASDDTYDSQRAEKLLEMLRALAQRIVALDGEGRLLGESSSLLRALGDIRVELFRYEVRHTFDTPQIAEHRRIVEDAARGWSAEGEGEPDEEEPWQRPDGR